MNNLYITTTLPYINGKPHIGHALEFVLGDCISKYFKNKLGKENVFFNVGLDEHGLKVYETAASSNITIDKHLNDLTLVWKNFCESFNIKYDSFYKTSSESHHRFVKLFWEEQIQKGNVYKKFYTGKYCKGCESFKFDKEILNDRCIEHQTITLEEVREENWFFKLSNYKETLIDWINNNPTFLKPNLKLQELKNLIENCNDVSISRLKKNCPHGVEFPTDENSIVYVWADALLSYIFSCKYYEDKNEFLKWWDNTVQLCGPDNLRFQAVMFQAFLESANIKKTKKLLVHGTILDEKGDKMSKSVGNVIDPIDQIQKYGIDAVRYYILKGLNTYSDSNWSEKDLIELYNNDLANGYGNLMSRVLHLVDKYNIECVDPTTDFFFAINAQISEIETLWNNFEISQALVKTFDIVNFGNKYIDINKPWMKESHKDNAHFEILSNLYYLVKIVTKYYQPVFSEKKYFEILESIKANKKFIAFQRIENN
jgi:methionyl-tRNA synthetase